MKALITGASSGIGKELALLLSTLGYDLYVVSRNKHELETIYQTAKTKVIPLEYDLSQKANCLKLYKDLKDQQIDLLINNAGFGDAGNFTETSLKKELTMIDVNIKAYHILTKLFLQDFKKRNRGRILNVASFAGFIPGPYMATYYATKAYVVNLSLAISEELKHENSQVKISIFCPGPVQTNFNNVAKVRFNIKPLSATTAAKCALNGLFTDQLIIIPNNMKVNYILKKIAPVSLILEINSLIQQRVSSH